MVNAPVEEPIWLESIVKYKSAGDLSDRESKGDSRE